MPVRGVYINLDRSEERRAHVEGQLAKLGPDHGYQRFAAIDGRRLSAPPGVKNPAELGCYLSHLEVLKAHADSDDWLHVLEDDVVISRPLGAAIATYTADPAFAGFDIIFTNVMFQISSEAMGYLRTLFDRVTVTTETGAVRAIKNFIAFPLDGLTFHLATSYLVNPRAIGRTRDLLAHLLKTEPFIPVDDALARFGRTGDLSVACTMPFFTVPRFSRESTIRENVSHCRMSQLVMEAAFYADRDVEGLWTVLRHLAEDIPADKPISATSALLAEANRVLVARDMDIPDFLARPRTSEAREPAT